MSEDIRNHNNKQTFLRNAIIGVLDMFNKHMSIPQVENGKEIMYPVPFWYDKANDEQFMKDFFINYPGECRVVNTAEGDYDKAPKGTILFNSFKIMEAELTNRFVRGTYKDAEYDDNDRPILKAFSAYLMTLPMQLDFTGQLWADNLGQSLLLSESLIDTFYKNNVIYFQYEGIRIPGMVSIAENADVEKKTSFTYTDDQKMKVKFNFQVETYYPSFDKTTKVFRGNTIRQFIANYENRNGSVINTTITTPDSKLD